jgi:mono/diheme cytochrome c family protein
VLNEVSPTPETVAQGRKVFLASCAHCHGADATGDEGPDLHGVEVSDRYIANIITHGIKGEMPSFRKKLGPGDIHMVTAFIRSLEP